MSVQPCRECGQNVSTEARTCPRCGAPAPAGDVHQVQQAQRTAREVERGQVDALRTHRRKKALASTLAILGLAVGFASCAAGAGPGVWLTAFVGALVIYALILLR